MIQNCCVQDCKHTIRTNSCSLKRFPSDPQQSKLWESLVKRGVSPRPGAVEWKKTPWDRICECHFDDDQFDRNCDNGVKELRKNAMPSLFGKQAKVPPHRASGEKSYLSKEPEDQGSSITLVAKEEHPLLSQDIPDQVDMSQTQVDISQTTDTDNISLSSNNLEHVEEKSDELENDTTLGHGENTDTEETLQIAVIIEKDDPAGCSVVEGDSSKVNCEETLTYSGEQQTVGSNDADYENDDLDVQVCTEMEADGGGELYLNQVKDGLTEEEEGDKGALFCQAVVNDSLEETVQEDCIEGEAVGGETLIEGENTGDSHVGHVEGHVHDVAAEVQEEVQEGDEENEEVDDSDEDEEEVSEDEYGEEIEVEIQDCSDGEMEPGDGVTYIITEEMIVVEEPDSPGTLQSGDIAGDGSSIEEDQLVGDEPVNTVQRTKRFFIKVPTSISAEDSISAEEETKSTTSIEISEIGDDITSDSSAEKDSVETDLLINTPCEQIISSADEEQEESARSPSEKVCNNVLEMSIEEVHPSESGMATENASDTPTILPAYTQSDEKSEGATEIANYELSEASSPKAVEETSAVSDGIVSVATSTLHADPNHDEARFLLGEEKREIVASYGNTSPADLDDMLERQMGALHADESVTQEPPVRKETTSTAPASVSPSVEAQAQLVLTIEDSVEQCVDQEGETIKTQNVDGQKEIGDVVDKESICEYSQNPEKTKHILLVKKSENNPKNIGQSSARSNKIRLIDSKYSSSEDKTDGRKSVEKETKHHKVVTQNTEVTDLNMVKTVEPHEIKKRAHNVSMEGKTRSVTVSKNKSKSDSQSEEKKTLVTEGASSSSISSAIDRSDVRHSSKETIVKPEKKSGKSSKPEVRDKIVSPSRKNSSSLKETKEDGLMSKSVSADSKGRNVEVMTPRKVSTESKESRLDTSAELRASPDGKESKLLSPKKLKSVPKAEEVSARSSRHEKQVPSKSSSNKSSSSSQSSKSKPSSNSESPSKERKGSAKELSSRKQSSSANSFHRNGKEHDSKSGIRSVRLRKHASRVSVTDNAEITETVPPTSKREKVRASETALPSRHSERVCRATEKAIASGILSRRSRSMSGENGVGESSSDPSMKSDKKPVSPQKSKRKAESSVPSVEPEESSARRRRSMRSSDQNSVDSSNSTEQSVGTGKKSRAQKRRGSPVNMSSSKKSKFLPGTKVDSVFVASIPKMCRVCGSENENLLNVLGPEGKSLNLAEKIHNILPIKIVEKEPLPTGVCHSCVVTLIACEKLVEKSSQLDKQLRIHFNCANEKEHLAAANKVPPIELLKASGDPVTQSAAPSDLPNQLESVAATKSVPSGNEIDITPEQPPEESVIPAQQDLLLLVEASERMAVEHTEAKNTDSEDTPPVLEAEPPPSQIQPANQEVQAQPPVLVPQPAKPLPELMPIDDSASPMKRFGNTYKPRVKPGQQEKIEQESEVVIEECYGEPEGESQEEPGDNVGDPQLPVSEGSCTITTEEFHIVDLEMNVEEVHSEIEEDGQPSSPKSVVDSILVDWSGDEDENGAEFKSKPVAVTNRKAVVTVASGSKDQVVDLDRPNNTTQTLQPANSTQAPCLFVDEDDMDLLTRSKALKSNSIDTKCVKQESFWPEPNPSSMNTVTTDKHPNDVPWKCNFCGKRGKSISKFLEHKKLHVNDGKQVVSCSKCSESFSNHSLLKSHMKIHDGDDVDEEATEERLAKQGVTLRRRAVIATGPRDSIVDVDLTPDDDGLYHCSLCQNAFTNIEALCQHKLIHKQNEDAVLYRCEICRRTFFQNRDYQDHMASHLPGQKKPVGVGGFQCVHCDLKLTSQKEFVDHINSHTLESSGPDAPGQFICDICRRPFETRGKLKTHRSSVHKASAYACHLCDKICQKRITLIEHLRKHSGDNPFACPVCDKRFNRLANYKAHMMIHENARRYECPYCGKRFNRQSIQQRHMKTHTNERARKHRCRVCSLSFNVATEMFNHRKLHSREEVERANWEDEKQRMALTSFPCKVCQLAFASVEEVLAHMPDHTDDERDVAVKLKNPRLECDICGKVLNSKRTFNTHRSSHIDGKPFVCKICQKGYATTTGLNYHMLSHTGERPFPCTFCNKGYKNSTDLKVHMRQHTGEFPYKCNLCNKAFRSASSLQKHGFVHTEERPHKCQYCGMSFKRESTKVNHERIHTNDRRYKCKVCGRSFIQKGACDAHEKLHFRGNISQVFNHSDNISGIIGSQTRNVIPSSASTFEVIPTEKQEIIDELEEDDYDEDDDEDDEYIIYEDEEDGDEDEMDADSDSQHRDSLRDPLKSTIVGRAFGDPSKSSNGVSMPGTSIIPVPVSVGNDVVPSAGDDASVHITIL